jgi:hypothetical protein
MSEANEEDPVAEKARATLRQGIGRSRKLAAEARVRLSELSSPTPYAGPANFILAEASDESPDADGTLSARECGSPPVSE